MVVWLTPAGSRPWVSGTSDNSIWSLIWGYNGVGRVDGQAGGPGGAGPGGGGRGGGGGNSLFGGDTGPLRLLNDALGGQAGWLLGFAIAGGIGIAVATRMRRSDARTGWLIAVGGAFATTVLVFSFAQGIFHPYYVAQLAPFTAALVGAGAVVLVRGGVAMRVLAPVAIAAGVWAELKILGDNSNLPGWLGGVVLAVAVGAAAALAMEDGKQVRAIALAVALGALLIAPAAWATQTLGHPTNGTFPAGGSQSMTGGPGGFGGGAGRMGRPAGALGGGAGGPGAMAGGGPGGAGGGMFGGNSQQLTSALKYVQQHGGGTIAVSSQQGASASLISGDTDVTAIGGFSGRESQVSVDWLANAIDSGQIRWVLTGGQMSGPGGDTRTGSIDVMAAVAQTCKPVSGQSGLYDCQGMADALRALSN
jgi:hypothetical protein